MAGYTLAEAREMLQLYKQCERDILSGQVRRYKIGSREVEILTLEEARAGIRQMSQEIAALEGSSRKRRTVRNTIFRDT